VNGTGGYASGTFNGTSTTFGSQTTMLPFTINTFSKFAVYFAEVPRKGAGLFVRPVNNEEMLALETRHALVVRWVRDGSPGYTADIFPGDIILSVNGRPADSAVWQEEQAKSPELQLELLRIGSKREIAVVIPPEWR